MTLRGLIIPSIMKTHPLTGAPIEPVGVVGNRYVWPIMGGAPTDDDDDDDDDDTSGDDVKDKNDSKDGGGDVDDTSGDDDDDKVSKTDLQAALARMKAADKRAAAAEAALKKKQDAEKGELEKVSDDLSETKTALEDAQKVIKTLRLQNSFLTANNQKWHDPDTALDLAASKGYLDDVTDEDGVVDKKALTKALEKLAKDKPFLVDSGKGGKDDSDDDDGPSGTSSGGRSDNSKDANVRRQQLKSRFASLNR